MFQWVPWNIFYTVDGGVARQLIHEGAEFHASHPLPGVYTGRNCVMLGDVASRTGWLDSGVGAAPGAQNPYNLRAEKSLAGFDSRQRLALSYAVPSLPPGTLPPVVLPFDPTSTTPVCIVAVDSPDGSQGESILYDVGRYEVRNMLMSINGAIAPVVYGGKIRAVIAYLDVPRRALFAALHSGLHSRHRVSL